MIMDNLLEKTKFEISDNKNLASQISVYFSDGIEIVKPGESLIALKNVTINEPFSKDTFLENLLCRSTFFGSAVPGRIFFNAESGCDPLSKNMFFTTVEKARFKKPIRPGDQLR